MWLHQAGGIGGIRYLGFRLGGVLVTVACVIVLSDIVAGQSGKSAAPIGVEKIKRVLTSHERWTLYWDVGDIARPRFGSTTTDRSPSATLEFMRVGSRVVGHWENDQVHHLECEFEVTVEEDGFTFAGCVGSDKRMTYDQEDGEYPFKGRVGGALFWLAPSR